MNVLILEVDYNFKFKSHPELRRGANPITKVGARKLAATCRRYGVRLIPQFQSLGHQSWRAETFPLLTKYPEFDLTPGAFPGNKGTFTTVDGREDFYCREWNPLNPEVNKVVFQLMDEIIDAFRADAMHVGMDEVFLLGSEYSPATRGKDPAELFAKAVNDLHSHLVGARHVEMLMWGDRLIDGRMYGFGSWEASTNGTARAADMIPKDINVCPWHYEKREAYPSIPMLLGKGFRVLPAGWNKVDATLALIDYERKQSGPKLLGHMFTTWDVKKEELLTYPPLDEGLKLLGDRLTAAAEKINGVTKGDGEAKGEGRRRRG
ncbi:MAG: family 20 glycosylhydrolase [Acidobacteriota bacterium]|nr:family 20 glycosylhydrolase [Acidobacteriota bacterium]